MDIRGKIDIKRGRRQHETDKHVEKHAINSLLTAIPVLILTYVRGIRANGFFQSNTNFFLLFHFIRNPGFCVTSPNLNVIFLANCHEN